MVGSSNTRNLQIRVIINLSACISLSNYRINPYNYRITISIMPRNSFPPFKNCWLQFKVITTVAALSEMETNPKKIRNSFLLKMKTKL